MKVFGFVSRKIRFRKNSRFLKATETNKFIFGREYQENCIFCLMNSLCKEPKTYFNICGEAQNEEHLQHPASKLLFCGVFDVEHTRSMILKANLVPVAAINGPAIVIRDFNPIFFGRTSNIVLMNAVGTNSNYHIIL